MSSEETLQRIHRAGFGITVSLYVEDDAYAVVLWRDGKALTAGRGLTLVAALEEAEERAQVTA